MAELTVELDAAAACVGTIEAAKTADPTNAEAVAVDAKVAGARAVQAVKVVQVVNEMVADEAIVHKAETTVHRAVAVLHNHPTVVLTTVNNAVVDNPTGAKAVDGTTGIEGFTTAAVAQRHSLQPTHRLGSA